MTCSAKWLVLTGLLAAGIVVATGCDKGPPRPSVDSTAVVGTWIEVVPEGQPSRRMRAPTETKSLRYITLKSDQTYEFTLRTKSGEPMKNASTIEGTWSADVGENEITFEVTNNGFPDSDERRDWAPASTFGIREQSVRGHGMLEVLAIEDLEGGVTRFVRAK